MVKTLYLPVVFHIRRFSVCGSPNLVIVCKFHIVKNTSKLVMVFLGEMYDNVMPVDHA